MQAHYSVNWYARRAPCPFRTCQRGDTHLAAEMMAASAVLCWVVMAADLFTAKRCEKKVSLLRIQVKQALE